ncbi:DNA polymerase III subunit alpha [Porphyromonas circumdentaria]|uniref:DNA polymerase III subunit alpha n=1 Tax=Porphyromonas circumdentaria TaxID=29524 RepID=A0A1T4L090_9PORP|nr:DNA polymerase III subunit alpha [Porphyromonas circumdentaria]MBB6275165.1 DNA polymerase-3 subunit alpha [Porphyromonas circumdentaria]SJZ48125.1 DNA polymerase III, alpha subunit [Porphyromonas circumdentaria]
MTPFVHLHVHSQYSILDGLASVKSLVKKAKKDGMKGLALTDHGVMFGIKSFADIVRDENASANRLIKEKKAELRLLAEKESLTEEELKQKKECEEEIKKAEETLFKPIYGCEAYCARRTRHDKDKNTPDPYNPTRSIDRSGWHLILLAKNKTGYQNLIKMVSLGFSEGEYYKPRIDKELLEKYHEGIIVLSACLGGEIPQHIMAGRLDAAEETALWFKKIFGEDFYLEVQLHRTENPRANRETYLRQLEVNEKIYALSERLGIKVVATNDVHFTNEEDAITHDRLLCVSTGRSVNDPNRLRYSQQEWLKTQQEMNEIFADRPELLSTSLEILDKVEYYSIENDPLMPDFPIPDGFKDSNEYLKYLTYEGAKERYGDPVPDHIQERIDFELKTIEWMQYPGYFLIVQDFIQAAREHGVWVGPGRGSAAGSAVAYCLKITNLDPLKYGLLFERFLNPDRQSLPDIDIDFDDEGRAKVLQWVTEKYGENSVAHIITFGEMAAKSAIKDNVRIEELLPKDGDYISNFIPSRINAADLDRLKEDPELKEDFEKNKKKITIAKSIALSPQLRSIAYGQDERLRRVLKYAQQMEGTIRNSGVHACGIIIGKSEISDVVPTIITEDSKTKEKILVTQYEGGLIESTGLIKMDFLGLKTLSIMAECCALIKKRYGIDIDVDKIPLDDPEVYQLFSEGKTIGLFQFESPGMQKYLRELKPDRFEFLIAMNALYRPGPMDYIPTFIARRHGREAITYDLPVTQEILQETYGVTVYQEQVMQLSRLLADFTRGESDNLRKAMGKKKIEQMNVLKGKFLAGGVKNGYSEEILLKIWGDWEKFAEYAFNKSHSAAYSLIAYQTGYFKAHYTPEFLAGCLSCNLSNATELSKILEECKAMNIEVLSPDINESEQKFSVNSEGNIRFGLSAIKGISENIVLSIIREREEHGSYKDIFDFVKRMSDKSLNRSTLATLALAGGLDSMKFSRETYFAPSVENPQEDFIAALLRYGNYEKSESEARTGNLFGEVEEMQIPHPTPPEAEAWTDIERLSKEAELVGFYLSATPLDPYTLILEKYCNTKMEDFQELADLQGRNLIFGGMLTSYFEGVSKKGRAYAKLTLEDFSGQHSFFISDKVYSENKGLLTKGSMLLCHASVEPRQYRPEELDVSFKSISFLDTVKNSLIKRIIATVTEEQISADFVESLIDVMQAEKKMAENAKKNDPQPECELVIRVVGRQGRYSATLIPKYIKLHNGEAIGKLLKEYCIEYQVE